MFGELPFGSAVRRFGYSTSWNSPGWTPERPGNVVLDVLLVEVVFEVVVDAEGLCEGGGAQGLGRGSVFSTPCWLDELAKVKQARRRRYIVNYETCIGEYLCRKATFLLKTLDRVFQTAFLFTVCLNKSWTNKPVHRKDALQPTTYMYLYLYPIY